MKRKEFMLYHVTSSEYIQSIRRFGLGAIDPNKKYHLLAILEKLFVTCEKQVPDDENVIAYKVVSYSMINQLNPEILNPFTGSIQQENFSHGALYLNTTELNEVKFAYYNPYGSEILNRIFMYLKIMDKYELRYDSILNLNPSIDFYRIMNSKPKVILLKFKYYEGLSLEIEDKYDKMERDAEFNNIELFNENIENPEFISKFRLRTHDIIHPKKLKFHELRISPDLDDFDYSLMDCY